MSFETRYAIETDLGFDHGDCWWHNINFDRLIRLDCYEEAQERAQDLEREYGCKWTKIFTV